MTNRELFRVSKRRLCELTSQYYEPVILKEVAYEKVSKHFGYFLFFMNQNQHEVKYILTGIEIQISFGLSVGKKLLRKCIIHLIKNL